MGDKKLKLTGIAVIILLCAAVSNASIVSETSKADEALRLLDEGNARFVSMKLLHPDQTIEQREKTALEGQKPFAAVLSCSDSRVPVEVLFDRGIGDIFVVRVAGNIAKDSSVIGSIEYAAEHVHVPLLVVMGHTDCGAVKAGLSGSPAEGRIRDIQKGIEPVAAETRKEHPDLQGADLVNAVAKSNALRAKADILSQSLIIREMADSGKLRIMTAVYDIKTGKVEWFE
jgi:carbonic anhydrase